jgi:hypothetical protein
MNGKMGKRRKNIAYASFDDVNDQNYRCKFERCQKIIRSQRGATNLIAHLKTHKIAWDEYKKKKEEIVKEQTKARDEMERKSKAQVKITDHICAILMSVQ